MTLSPARLACILCALSAGCGQVDVQPENRRFGELLTDRLGAPAEIPAAADQAPVGTASAPEASDGRVEWTEEAAVRTALLFNPSVRAELARIGIAKADLVQAGLLPNPVVSGNVIFMAANPILYTVDVGQQLLLLGQIPLRRLAAEAALDRTLLQSADSVLAELAAVRRTYHELVLADGQLDLARQSEAIFRNSVKVTEGRKEAGTATTIDVNLARTQMLQAQAEIEAALGRRDRLRADLASRLARPAWQPDWSPAKQPAGVPPEPPALEAALEAAAESRLDLQVASQRIREAEFEVRQAQIAVIPVLTAGVTVSRQPPVYVGPNYSIPVPIFDQGLTRIARAGFALEEARRMREAAELIARREVAGAHADAAAAHRQLGVLSRELVPTAEANLRLTEDSFRNGQSNLLTVLAAQQAFVDAKRRLLAAVRDYRVGLADLDRATGRWLSTRAR